MWKSCHSEWEEMQLVAMPEWEPVLVRSSKHAGDSSRHIHLPLALTVRWGQELWPPCSSPRPVWEPALVPTQAWLRAVAALLIPEACAQPWVCTQ